MCHTSHFQRSLLGVTHASINNFGGHQLEEQEGHRLPGPHRPGCHHRHHRGCWIARRLEYPGSAAAASSSITVNTSTSVPTSTVSAEGAAASSAPAAAASSAPAAAASSAPAAPASSAPASPSMTTAQQQAVDAAEGYLSLGQGFSGQGLLQQLTSSAGNGFSKSDAEFAINYLNPNWDQQAVDSAKGYLSLGQGFSGQGLLQQLTSSAGSEFTRGRPSSPSTTCTPTGTHRPSMLPRATSNSVGSARPAFSSSSLRAPAAGSPRRRPSTPSTRR